MQYFSLLFFDVDLPPLPSQQQAQYFVLKMLPILCQEKKHLFFTSEFLQAGRLHSSRFLTETLLKQFSQKKVGSWKFSLLENLQRGSSAIILHVLDCTSLEHWLWYLLYFLLTISPSSKSTDTESQPVHLEWETSPAIFNWNPSYWKIIE